MTFKRFYRTFDAILYITLQKLIGQRSWTLSGFATFEIWTTTVLLYHSSPVALHLHLENS